ncbi:MAG: 50S ribosomal protein L11 [Hyphomicrobiales bacterium]|nr:50S ribosomal protein L11 [Hyphomicrobiales bacterium]
MAPKKSNKKVASLIKLQIQAGKANPSPPVGPALGQAGLNIMDFCKAFNDATKNMEGPVPVVITAYQDRTFDFVTKLAPASYLLMKAANLPKGSQKPGQTSAGTISIGKVREVAEKKMEDLNAHDLEAATRMIAGTARSMGLEVTE